jgi:hypothetical protein
VEPQNWITRDCPSGVKTKTFWTAPYEVIFPLFFPATGIQGVLISSFSPHIIQNLFKKVIGEPGKNCDVTCLSNNQKCDVHFFHHLIQEVRAEVPKLDKRCSADAISGAYPALTRKNDYVYSSCARWYSCDQEPDFNFRRVCPCVEEIVIYQ